MTYPTGEQFALSFATPFGTLQAVITELAAGLRTLCLDGVDLVESFDERVSPPFCSGIMLAPWVNRIPDGRWADSDGFVHQLAVTEVERNNALHGLLRFAPYTVVERSESAITLAAQVYPQIGYPFHLETLVRYELVEDGITVTHTVRNIAEGDAPVTLGSHPFLKIGGVPTEDLVLTINADTHIDINERLNPIARSAVDGTPFDLRESSPVSRRVGDLALDDAWGDAHVNNDESVHTLTAPDGRTIGIWGDANYDHVQVFITPLFPALGATIAADGSADEVVTAIAVEPMTGPADAYNSGQGLMLVAPGEQWESQWGIRFTGFETLQ